METGKSGKSERYKITPDDIDDFYRAFMAAKDKAISDSTLRVELNSVANRELALEALGGGTANGAFRVFIGTILAGFTVHLLNATTDGRVKVFYSDLMEGMLNILLRSEYSTRDYKVFIVKLKREDREDYLTHLIKSCLDVCIKNITRGFDKVLNG
ncbi:MAG: hypothetical protein M0P69_06440 [Bacteroidales bacterium]|nr:hypothetical protein [Bacteroidales bacterium]